MTACEPFAFPPWFDYPPSFTLQPIPETFQKQLQVGTDLDATTLALACSLTRSLARSLARQLWSSLILSYCAHHRLHVIDVYDGELRLFRNDGIDRHLNVGERRVVLDALAGGPGGNGVYEHCAATRSRGRWLDGSVFLVLWRPVEESVLAWVEGQVEGVVLLEDVVDGLGLGRWACGQEVVREAVEVLERGGRVKTFAQRSNGRKHVGVKLLQA